MDCCNPTVQDIRDWANDASADWPDEEWDMTVATRDNAVLIFQLADEACPQADFFVHCLYVLVGCFAATGDSFIPRADIHALIAKAGNSHNNGVRRWGDRSKAFLANPEAYDRECWVEGGWALDEEIWQTDQDKDT
jgi:hypothetical protein